MKLHSEIDTTRTIRMGTLALTIVAGTWVYTSQQPRIDTLSARLEADRTEVRADELAESGIDRLRAERAALTRRFVADRARDVQGRFLSDLARIARRRGITVISTTWRRDLHAAPDTMELFSRIDVSLQVRGTYGALLDVLRDVSRGPEFARVTLPSLRRDGAGLIASIPISLYEPLGPRAITGAVAQ